LINNLKEIIDIIYPIGSVYISVNSTNPQSLFGGTWVQLQNRFLLGAGSSYSNGATGGESSHTLTINEMPSHNHYSSSTSRYLLSTEMNPNAAGDIGAATGTKDWKWTTNVTPQGGGQAHNNMPPYLVVNMWKRTN